MEDAEIIKLYFDRDDSAVAETRRKYGSMVLGVAMNVLRVREDAEECESDTYLHAWNAIPPQRPGRFRPWLARVARNLSLDRYRANRAKKRYDGAEVLLSELEDCVPAPSDVEKTVLDGELSGIVDRWLSGLDGGDTAAFLRRYFFGDAVKDIAVIMDESPARTAKRLYRLRQDLRALLEKEGISL
jgi:RNA polymerase sigma-70 factor (ECF subfamily)